MRGVTEERLMEILESDQSFYDNATIQDLLQECTELTQWQPIESAPLNKPIRLFRNRNGYKSQDEGELQSEIQKSYYTQYCELPEDPK